MPRGCCAAGGAAWASGQDRGRATAGAPDAPAVLRGAEADMAVVRLDVRQAAGDGPVVSVGGASEVRRVAADAGGTTRQPPLAEPTQTLRTSQFETYSLSLLLQFTAALLPS